MDVQEQWETIAGYNGLYEVSNMGNVRKKGQIKLLKICTGYGMRRVVLRAGDDFHLVAIAKLVLEAFVGEMPEGMKPNCIDCNYENLCLTNLCWVERRKRKYTKAKKVNVRHIITKEELQKHSKYITKRQ